MVSVLFVCLGNICRSPMAEGVFRHVVDEAGLGHRIAIDSAGTGPWHVGKPPDERARATAARHGIDIGAQRARQVAPADFAAFHYVLAMDRDNLKTLHRAAPKAHRDRIRLFLDFAADDGANDVPDPYYGGPEGFEDVYALVEGAAAGLLRHIRHNDL